MELEDLLGAISKHVEELDGNVKWTVGLGCGAAVLALQGGAQIALLGLNLPRQHAFYVLVLLIFGQCLLVRARMRVLKELLLQVNPQHVSIALSRLSVSSSFLNPFAFWRRPDGTYYAAGLNALSYLSVIYCICVVAVWLLLPPYLRNAPLDFGEVWRLPFSSEMWSRYWSSSVTSAPYGLCLMLLIIGGFLAKETILEILPSLSGRLDAENESLKRHIDEYSALLTRRAARDDNNLTVAMVIAAIVQVVRLWP